jgi:hypothetical protein
MSRLTPFRESVLRGFFLGDVEAADLGRQAMVCIERVDEISVNVHLRREENGDFVLTTPMVVQLCEVAISGELPYEALPAIAFILYAGTFNWGEDNTPSGELYRCVIECLSELEINYPLNRQTLEMFRRWLLGTELPPPEQTLADNAPQLRLVHRTKSVFRESARFRNARQRSDVRGKTRRRRRCRRRPTTAQCGFSKCLRLRAQTRWRRSERPDP